MITHRQQSQLLRLARVDPLTKAGNRMAMDEKLDAVNAVFHRTQLPASILMLDVDHFKAINDSYGHATGDQVLIEVADLIRDKTRATENLFRFGGEEFVVVAEQTGREAASRLGERLRSLVEQQNFVSNTSLTVSVGVAEFRRGEGRQDSLNRADAALFRAKAQGRNRVIIADAPADSPAGAEPAAAAKKQNS